MSRLSWKEFERLAGEFFERELGTRLFSQWPVHLKNGRTHKFDFSSGDERIVVQCKSLTWTESGHYPSGKVAEARQALQMLQESNGFRKIIVFDEHLNHKGQSFVEVFVRRNKDSLSGIEVWQHLDGKFKLYFASINKLNPVDAYRGRRTACLVPVNKIALDLQTTPGALRAAASAIENKLKNEGIIASFQGINVRLKWELLE